ncbi:sodium-dependent transporter [Marinoscillum sp. MHG1-6]|uniref:sodium-dependent transporter n=1 Tax=Marinoscillum sp. MHG1-6 TaxID=2959627 RepID=UPI00215734FC|nr:sodium-dependent transporter [Marinoscillum sp. MHG1-6]
MATRGSFSNRLGFVLAAAGSAVGLGNIWKFPFEVALGGGAAFVLMYLLFCFLLCFPVMVTEVTIGRKTQKNPVGAFTALGFKNWRFIGVLGLVAGVVILSFYNVIAGWAFGYFVEMASGNFAVSQNFGAFTSDWVKVGLYAIVFMFFTAFFVSKGVSGGIERLAKILMPSLIVMILILVGYSFTLPNAMEGVKFYLIPDVSAINIGTIGGALRQAFFSLSLGMGALITYGSYLSKNDNIVSSSAFITLADVGIAFIAGLMIFPLVAYNNGGDMSMVQSDQAGPGLIFITLPGVFETLGPGLGAFIGAFFFLLLSFAALTSTVSLLEVPVSYAVDELRMRRKPAVIVVAIIIFVVGIPSLLANGASDFFGTAFKLPRSSDFLSLVAGLADIMLLFGGFLIVSFAAFIWKKHNLHEEIASGYEGYENTFVKKGISFLITFLCPFILAILFVLVLLDNFFGIALI